MDNSYRNLIMKILDEVDPDIKIEMRMLGQWGDEAWTLLPDPANTILRWQELRDRKKLDFYQA